MAQTFVVEITVNDAVAESTFGTSMVKGLQDGSLHHLSWLHCNIENIEVRPYQEYNVEWAVQIASADKDGPDFEFGFFGKEFEALEAARKAHPGCAIIGAYVKPGTEEQSDVRSVTFKNSDDLVLALAKELAGDMQMEIDDHDIGRNMPSLDYLIRRGVQTELVKAMDVYRTNP